MADTLSQQSTGTCERNIWSSLKSRHSQDNSATMVAKARYSTSVKERDTMDCFLEDQDMGLGPRKTR